MVKTYFAATNTLGGIKALPRINTRFGNNGFMRNSNGNLGHGDVYEDRVAVIRVSGFVNS
jgi:hypothetical protein